VRILLFIALLASWKTLGAEPSGAVTAEIPFEFRDGLLWVKVNSPNTPEPLNFLLDTGASVSTLNLETACRLQVHLGQRVIAQGVGARTAAYWPQTFEATADGGFPLPTRYLAVDLCALGQSCHCQVDGLIGADFFRGRIVQIDFAAHRVRLLESAYPDPDAQILELRERRGALCVSIQVGQEKPRWTRLDTGCASSLQWVTKQIEARHRPRNRSIGLTELAIPSVPMSVRLGSQQFDSVETGLHRREFFPGEAGLLGNGLLAQFETMTVDGKRHRLILGKRRHP
jgi:hypothetical protein